MTAASKIDSNITGLRYAEEASLGTLPATPIWHGLEPNSYADLGGQITTVARNPINPSRQRKKGVVTDLEASGGFNTDLTQSNLQDILQGFFFANMRTKDEFATAIVDAATDHFEPTVPAVSSVIAVGGTGYAVGDLIDVVGGTGTAAQFIVTEVLAGVVVTLALVYGGAYTIVPANPAATTHSSGSGDDALTLTITWDSGADYAANDLLFAKGFDDAANNGLHVVTGVPTTHEVRTTSNLVAAVAQTGTISRVGFSFAVGDASISVAGTLPVLATAAKDCTELGLIPGEWVFIGGDTALNQFATAANNCFARVRSVATNAIEFDKSSGVFAIDAGAAKEIHLFFGRVLKNESVATDIIRRTYNVERTLGAADEALPAQVQSEYLVGAVPSEFTLSVPSADKVMCDLSFMATDNEQRTGATGVKTGTRPSIPESDAFNTSSDVSRIKMAVVSSTDSAPDPLFAYLTEITITLNNNISLNKAVGVLGAFDATAGNFNIGGSCTAYFADVAAVEAVRNNSDITVDVHLVKDNAGITIDLPLLTLGNGKLNVEQDAAIMLPFDLEAATAASIDTDLDHTALMVFWDYLPDLAE